MKGRLIALDRLGRLEAAALLEDGRLEDLLVAQAEGIVPGSICRGVLDRPMKGQGGAFVRLPGATGFLRQAKGLAPGQPILVQITGHAEDGKAMPATDRVLFKSRYAIVTPDAPGLNLSRRLAEGEERERLSAIAAQAMAGADPAWGLILRSAAGGADGGEVREDIRAMLDLAARVLADPGREPALLVEGDGPHILAWRDWSAPAGIDSGPGSFARAGVLEAIDALRVPDVPLGAGGMVIEPTRALVAVDVNTGGDTSPAAGLKADIACARELPRQLRLRGLGGQITIDPAPLAKRDRAPFEQALRAAFRADPVETALAGWTPLGHYELRRKRERLPLARLLAAAGYGEGLA